MAGKDPFATLRLLQVCNVQRFGHIISAVPPHLVLDFAISHDEAVTTAFVAIQQEPQLHDSTYSLPMGAGGAALASFARHASGSYLDLFFQVDGPLKQRLTIMGGRIINRFICCNHDS